MFFFSQDPNDKRQINCDEKLRAVFGKDSVTMFEMSKFFSQHILGVDAGESRPVAVTQPPPSAPKAKKSASAKSSSKKARVDSDDDAPDSDLDDDGDVDDVVESEGDAADPSSSEHDDEE